ncbi:MAG: hypothetical protein PHH08_00010 [Candidatus ainarchaeum sp.]|nr:hypothetical protein [Candidatus ainarchaeum sp.]
MADEKELLKRQVGFLQKSRASAEKTIKIFQGEMKKFGPGEQFESAKKAFSAVKERLDSIDAMLLRVQKELESAPSSKSLSSKGKAPVKPKKGKKSKKK